MIFFRPLGSGFIVRSCSILRGKGAIGFRYWEEVSVIEGSLLKFPLPRFDLILILDIKSRSTSFRSGFLKLMVGF